MKLNHYGFTHLILPLVVVALSAAIGGWWYVQSSDAATSMSAMACGNTLGRQPIMKNNKFVKCAKQCRFGNKQPVVADPYDYCTWAASKMSPAQCRASDKEAYINSRAPKNRAKAANEYTYKAPYFYRYAPKYKVCVHDYNVQMYGYW